MKRYHLFEWEDFGWFPSILRDLMTDYLMHVVVLFKMHEPVVPVLEKALAETGKDTVVDLASGGGGPWPAIAPALLGINPDIKIVLTDLFPNIGALKSVQAVAPEAIEVREDPVDALQVPNDLQGLRTQFLSLHHFEPHQVRTVFENAISARQPIAVFEFQQRSIPHLIQFALSPIFVLLLSFTIRPVSIARLFFTYIFPLVPFFVMWDGVVSVLRTYKPIEVQEIIDSIAESNSYSWDIRSEKEGQVTVFRCIGIPK
jgi:hypothetical protein